MSDALSPIQIEILWKRLISAIDEAAATLVRVSFSSVIRDFHDYACAIFDADGRMLAQNTRSTPGLLGILPYTMLNFLEHPLGRDLKPGDVLITNDPWLASGHLIDITVATPVFRKGKIVAYMLCIVHHLNVGGRVGTLLSRDIYEEGLKIPILKLFHAGEPDEDVFNFMRANIREADRVVGDLRAQIAANATAGAKLADMMAQANLDTLKTLADEIIGRSERSMREALRMLPEGESSCSASLTNIPGYDQPVTLALTVRVRGGEIELDYEGTSEQIPRAVNVTLNMTRSYCGYPLKCMLAPDIPNNAGFLLPIKVKAPSGSILNATFPAANWGRTLIAHMLPELIMRALATVVPDKLVAGNGATPLWYGNFEGRYSNDESFYAVATFNGGMGARKTRDGVSCITYPANVANIPIEVIENDAPILFECKELAPETAGAGRQRGGAGQHVIITVPETAAKRLQGPVIAGVRGSRFGLPILGIEGGLPAGPAVSTLNGVPVVLGTTQEMRPGDRLELVIPGGAGYGDPKERNPDDLERDIRDGFVTPEEAVTLYGGASADTDPGRIRSTP